MIKNIVFDMGDVLIYWDAEHMLSYGNLTDEEKALMEREIFMSPEWQLMDWGMLTPDEAYEKLKSYIPENLRVYAHKLVTRWYEFERKHVPGMADLVKALKEKGYGIYLLSNAAVNHEKYWGDIDGSEHFDGIVVSAYEKTCKPLPEIYNVLFKRFDLKPEECIFIDDRPINIAGGMLCGMDGIVFIDTESLKEKLKDKGIDF